MLENESNMHAEATNYRDFPGGLGAIGLHAPNTGGPSFDPLSGTRSHMLQPIVCMLQLKIPRAATKMWCSRINKYEK